MKATYWQKGETLDYTPEENVEAGTVLSVGGRIGVAAADIAAGQLGHVHMVGVFRMDKAKSEAIGMGAAVYYDEEAGAITAAASRETTEGETKKTVANPLAGYAAASAAAGDTSMLVKLAG